MTHNDYLQILLRLPPNDLIIYKCLDNQYFSVLYNPQLNDKYKDHLSLQLTKTGEQSIVSAQIEIIKSCHIKHGHSQRKLLFIDDACYGPHEFSIISPGFVIVNMIVASPDYPNPLCSLEVNKR